MEIQHKDTFETVLHSGLNLFVGAGFSILAKDENGNFLPTSAELTAEIVKVFSCPNLNDLAKVCTVVDSLNSAGLQQFLRNRLTVNEIDAVYYSLRKIHIKRVFTTNIDNIIELIYHNSSHHYINNVFINGSAVNDPLCIDYIPIHGSVSMPDSKFLFNKQEVTASYRTQASAWSSLFHAANQLPSVFIGYGLNDVGAIESLINTDSNTTLKDKWILIEKNNEDSRSYFEALGFKIIVGDLRELLKYFNEIKSAEQAHQRDKDSITEIFPKSLVPKNSTIGYIRPIEDFFLGSAPIWSDVFSSRIKTTHHLDSIINKINGKKHVIVTGIPASGKTTLLLQAAHKLKNTHRVLIFESMPLSKSHIIKNEIKIPTIIFVDNCTLELNSFINLTTNLNIKLVGFDRFYNVDIGGHRLSKNAFEFYDVSDLTQKDIQDIYSSIPLSIRTNQLVSRKREYEMPSIFEIVNYNVKRSDIKGRYKEVLDELERSDLDLLEILVVTCYLHACGVPISYEVLNSYLSDYDLSYDDIREKMGSLKGLVQDEVTSSFDTDLNDQDYFQPRSKILSETILNQIKNTVFSTVFVNFHERVPKHVIPSYNIFKRYGYDAKFARKAFNSFHDGVDFYEEAYKLDRNPHLLQQCAIFLLGKGRFSEAALTIDRAVQASTISIFSIQNTHAIILFKANIHLLDKSSDVRNTLDKSMKILQDCYSKDQRKAYHAITYAEQAIEYFRYYHDTVAIGYLNTALLWLTEIFSDYWDKVRIKRLIVEIEKLV